MKIAKIVCDIMGYYNDVVVQIKKNCRQKFEDYLSSDDDERILYNTEEVKENDRCIIYVWTRDHQLRVSARNRYFDLGYELEERAGLNEDDYVAEIWTEDFEHDICGKMEIEYMIHMDALLYNKEEMRYI